MIAKQSKRKIAPVLIKLVSFDLEGGYFVVFNSNMSWDFGKRIINPVLIKLASFDLDGVYLGVFNSDMGWDFG